MNGTLTEHAFHRCYTLTAASLTAVALGFVSLLSDFTLLLHPFQISIVLVLIGITVAFGCL